MLSVKLNFQEVNQVLDIIIKLEVYFLEKKNISEEVMIQEMLKSLHEEAGKEGWGGKGEQRGRGGGKNMSGKWPLKEKKK